MRRREVVVVGPLPPPVHGMAKSNARVVARLRSRCDVVVADISHGSLERRLRNHAVKICKVFRALVVVAARRWRGATVLYASADAGFGTWYTVATVTLGRLLGYKLFVHHHSFAYIDKRAGRMAVLVRRAGRDAVHVFLCSEMERLFREHYSLSGDALLLSNAAYIEPVSQMAEPHVDGLRLGHLSNLQPSKGLDVVLETLRQLRARDVDCRLVLAGPAVRAEDEAMIDAAAVEFGEALDYRGPVYGEEKRRFYRDIDVFLFPTQCEAQGIVLLDALAFGVAPVVFLRGCMVGDLQGSGAVAVPRTEDFVKKCLPALVGWGKNRELLCSARQKSLARAHELRSAADAELARFVDAIAGPNAPEDHEQGHARDRRPREP